MFSPFLLSDVALKPSNNSDAEEEGTRHFMVNVVQPQFNLHSEEANVSKLPLHFFAKFYYEMAFGSLTNVRLSIQCTNFRLFVLLYS